MDEKFDGSRIISPDLIIDNLRISIISGKYQAGDRIIEEDISKQFCVSRGTVRSAIKELEKEGLIRILSNGRKEVIGFTSKEARDFYDLRFLLENRALETVMSDSGIYLTPMVETLQKCEQKISELSSDADRFEMDIQFHQSLVMLARNRPLLMAWRTNMGVMYSLMKLNMVQTLEDYKSSFLYQHKQIFQMIVNRDENVFRILKDHILSASPK